MPRNDAADLELVKDALRGSPRVLLLGQAYLGGAAIDDPLSVAFATLTPGTPSPYAWWLRETSDVGERAKAFIRAEKAVLIPEGVRLCLRQAWTSVFASGIDSLARSLLDIPDRRQVQQLTGPGFTRGRGGDLPLFRLFGTVERATLEELPPSDPEALRRRRKVAAEILQSVGQAVSARGHLFVEGWNPGTDRDWLKPRELVAAITALDRDQVLVFGVDAARRAVLEGDDAFAELLQIGVVRLLNGSLSEYVAAIHEAGAPVTDDDWTTRTEDSVPYHVVVKPLVDAKYAPKPVDLRMLSVGIHEWRRLSAGLKILDELDPTRPLPAVAEEQRQLFRSFSATGANYRIWPWLSQLAFRRPALDQALAACLGLCRVSAPQDHVVILHGQAGSGKSVLMHLLALELRRLGLPVVFATRVLVPVDQTLIDDYCALLAREELLNAPAFFVYDATQPDAAYLDLASYLAGRNRKCVVVGSAHPGHFSTRHHARRHAPSAVTLVEVPVRLTSDESRGLLHHIEHFTGVDAQMLRRILGTDVSHFFAALYRLLPDSRHPLSHGLLDELLQGSARIEARIKEEKEERQKKAARSATEMELKLRAALGLELERITGVTATSSSDDGNTVASRRLIDAVMVASRFGLAVPQSIALRLIGTNIPAYRSSMAGDIIVEHETQPSVFSLSSRHPIEADIWVRNRLPQVAKQFEVIRSLALHIRSDEAVQDDSMELDFVVKLLQAVGPEGDQRFRMQGHYDAIGKVVGDLRLRHEVHPRLLLVEAHATREWIKLEQQKKPATTGLPASQRFEAWVSLLDKADQGLRHAMDMVLDGGAGYLSAAARRMLTTLATERAAVLGFKVGSVRRLHEHDGALTPTLAARTDTWLREARDAWREALRFDDENPRAVDAACWILKERVDCGIADPVTEAELLAEWGDLVDRYLEMDVPPSQLDRLDKAEGAFAAACGDVTRFKSVMDRAAARGSNGMHVLIARAMHSQNGAAAARAYLEKECGEALRTDRAVLLLYLRLWWESETGFDSYLDQERACLAFDQQRWETLEALASARLGLQGEQDHAVTHFLRACALLSLDRVEEANQAFEYLARLGLGGFRRSRSLLLLSTSSGAPRLLTAEFQGRRQAGICLAWCDELRTNVRFRPLDHGLVDLRPGTWLKPFHLSLSFRGMFAEPPHRLRESRPPERA